MVILDLNCLLRKGNGPSKLSGWFPIYDTLQGIRGFLHSIITVQFFGDLNPFKNSAAGVKLLSISDPSSFGYQIKAIQGFVEELIPANDPEYQWKDNFRTAQKSNEERQALLYHLARKVRREVGQKALKYGGNSVLGYRHEFDMEYETGMIIARGYGTACSLVNLNEIDPATVTTNLPKDDNSDAEDNERTDLYGSPERNDNHSPDTPAAKLKSQVSVVSIDAEQDFDVRSIIPHVGMSNASVLLDVHLLSIYVLPVDGCFRIGGIVCARSVKLLGNRESAEQLRNEWRTELRKEISSHAKALCCNVVVGYVEVASICEDICVLTSYGTAVRDMGRSNSRRFGKKRSHLNTIKPSEVDGNDHETQIPSTNIFERQYSNDVRIDIISDETVGDLKDSKHNDTENIGMQKRRKKHSRACSFCHLPYPKDPAPFRMNVFTCNLCKLHLVPELILSTIEPPESLGLVGQGQLIQARVFRGKRHLQDEANATAVSEALPFLELELHRQLLHKLRIMGLNCVFKLSLDLSIGEEMLIGIATGTAVFCPALPAPPPLKITRNIEIKDAEDERLFQLQKRIMHISEKNCERILNLSKIWIAQYYFAHPAKGRKKSGKSVSEEIQSNVIIKPIPDNIDNGDILINIHEKVIDPEDKKEVHPEDGNLLSTKDDESSESESSSSSDDSVGNDAFVKDKDLVIMQIDDETDEKTMTVLLDPSPPPGVFF